MPTLFDPVQLGSLHMPNRIVMAPLTRLRAGAPAHVPNRLMAEYYAQRADAGLIISEGVPVSPQAVGYLNVPGVWTAEQLAGWRLVTHAVHAAGGRIFMQIWHVGRISDPAHLRGDLPVAPSPLQAPGHVSLLRPQRPFVVPRSLGLEEIPGVIEAFRSAAQNAKAAGFDGVTIHGANGYLLDQFLQDGTNQRTDAYGGSVERRARLMLEVTDAVVSVWGADRVGMHLATRSPSHGVSDSHPEITFPYVAAELGKRKLAFLFVRETRGPGALLGKLKSAFGGAVIANDGFDLAAATEAVTHGGIEAVAFGRDYISNPDLVQRLRIGAPLNPLVAETIYDPLSTLGAQGYTDYPVLAS
ncbi:alkene reductase [Variovorax sp. J22R133]|uniref:alkene reductase n=1 Tax=Variovorax brevis TaxID=3053503 RepID=UPI002576A472|nr:alkene reductase [Variovorax sp. J22R133]MDM0117472.1 alkene reductase [Variovorax sp. J22R133]